MRPVDEHDAFTTFADGSDIEYYSAVDDFNDCPDCLIDPVLLNEDAGRVTDVLNEAAVFTCWDSGKSTGDNLAHQPGELHVRLPVDGISERTTLLDIQSTIKLDEGKEAPKEPSVSREINRRAARKARYERGLKMMSLAIGSVDSDSSSRHEFRFRIPPTRKITRFKTLVNFFAANIKSSVPLPTSVGISPSDVVEFDPTNFMYDSAAVHPCLLEDNQ